MSRLKRLLFPEGDGFNRVYPLFFTIAFIAVIAQYPFSSLEAIFYDLRVRWDFLSTYEKDIVVVSLDEESDDFLGETYPYTYATHSRFFKKLTEAKPLAIGMFVGLEEPENDVESGYLSTLKSILVQYKKQGGEPRFGTSMDNWGIQLPPVSLRELGHSLSYLIHDQDNFARDQVMRRAVLNYAGENTIHLYLANVIREKHGKKKLEPNNFWGSYYVREFDATYALFRYGKSGLTGDTDSIPSIPYHKVVTGSFDPKMFEGKIVLVGPQYISSSNDSVLTPFAKEEQKTPLLNMHALIISALSKDLTVYSLPRVVSAILSILIAFFLSIVISKVQPARGLLITVGTMLGIFIASILAFFMLGVWIYISHIILTIFVVYYIWVPFRAIAEYQTRYAVEEEAKLLKEVDKLKQNFISLMSHDLKTPVAKISGMADILLQQFGLEGEKRQLVQTIKDSTIELNNFISSILDLTKVESRKIELKITSRDINEIIKSIVSKLRFELQKNEMTLETKLDPLFPIGLDFDLITRVISNLVENGIKYAGKNKTIFIKTWDDENWIYVEISDNGLGIKTEDLEHIFDKFYRVKNDQAHSIKGTGLGLYLVKYFVELHKGTISVSSVYNEGTKFLIKLPNKSA